MSTPAAPSGAAPRAMRSAAGRLVLRAVLLVGGLLALGFLCGAPAQAAESGSSTAPPASPVVLAAPAALGPAVPAALAAEALPPAAAATPGDSGDSGVSVDSGVFAPREPSASRAADDVLRPLTDQVLRSVDKRIVQPVGDVAGTVAAALGEVTERIPPLSSLPSPSVPDSPSLPEIPGLPSAPGVPGSPGLPTLPGQTVPVPVTSAPQRGAEHSAEDPSGERRPGTNVSSNASSIVSSGAVYGPRLGDAAGAVTRGGEQRAAVTGYAPAHRAPAGDPAAASGDRAAFDSGTSRHRDASALALNDRAPLRLVPGAIARSTTTQARDRHRDIPVSPA
ncbi:hypothetical protein [Streptomyces sp. H51]|uniref:hypothetical protein n=1 Tax=Streptomyces sp. H51 TaxID=3111770 RepID=UPI002D7989AD|nr:hypothetical protein [Streptomyces sp. H51]